jgi:hypothetical protein
MCVRALGTCMPSCIDRSARLFFMLETVAHRESWDTWKHWSPPQSGAEVRSHRTRGSARAHLNREAWSGSIGHVIALEPTSAER